AAVTLQAQRPSGPDVKFAEAAHEGAEAEEVADWLADRAAAGVDYREMAVLFRINAQSPPIEQALGDRKIPYLVRGGERFYERPEVRQALLTLRTEARVRWEDNGQSVLDRVKAVFATLGWTPEPPVGAGAVRERWESLAALLSVAEDLLAGDAPAGDAPAGDAPAGDGSAAVTLAAVSAELDRRSETQHVPSAHGVTVSTLHSAKGLEWDAVALFGVHEGSLPFVLATTLDQIAEERRLLYVGVTRARQHLRVSWSRTRSGGGATRSPSRFLDPVLDERTRLRAATPAVKQPRPKTSVLSAHCRSCGHPLGDAGERKLGRHKGCPATYDEHTMAMLKDWRKQQAVEQSVPAYCVFTDATLMAIAEAKPRSSADLMKIHGLGTAKAAKYGARVLAIIADQPESQHLFPFPGKNSRK
nr:ATP-dependent DNA helicase UvrD2 [Propionibacteriaceae bacterium]